MSESVCVAPWDWISWGSDAVRKYKQQGRQPVFSHDHLLVTLVSVRAVHWDGIHTFAKLLVGFCSVGKPRKA